MIIADDADLAGRLASLFAEQGHYLPIIAGPRLSRDDATDECIECANAVQRVSPKRLILAGLKEEAVKALRQALRPSQSVIVMSSLEFEQALKADSPRLVRAANDPGTATLEAMRKRKLLSFVQDGPVSNIVSSSSSHIVVCEAGHALSEVIAACYAFALGASLQIIPQIERGDAENLMEAFYGIYAQSETSTTQRFLALCTELRQRCPGVTLPDGSSCTFISHKLPLGAGFPEVPTTNLFVYPKLGITIVNGFAAEQKGARGINVAALIDPLTTDAPEVEQAAILLANRKILVRGFRGENASVRAVSQMIDHWPYDLLFIATHCGDVSGHRWTYEFTDSEGIERRLVVEIALGVARMDDPEMLQVTQLINFCELDGVDWSDHNAKADLYVGTAINDFIARTAPQDGELQPVTKEHVERVSGSSALKMYDHNYLLIPRPIAGTNTPIIFNNACVSWHSLAEKFLTGNARAYVGTLIEVTPVEASEVAIKVFNKFFGKPIAYALWAAQRAVYGDSPRRPYVVSGVFPQKLRTTQRNPMEMLEEQLVRGLNVWSARTERANAAGNVQLAEKLGGLVSWHQEELSGLRTFRDRGVRGPN